MLNKGHEEAGAINFILRKRDCTLKLAVPAVTFDHSAERSFEWHKNVADDQSLADYMKREMRFDQDQWFVEIECEEQKFVELFLLQTP